MTRLTLSPYPSFPTELASILLLAFLLFTLVAVLSRCLCSVSPYLSIKLDRIYVCYTSIALYVAFGINRDTGALLYFEQDLYVFSRPPSRVLKGPYPHSAGQLHSVE
jgi:hypothetical protein